MKKFNSAYIFGISMISAMGGLLFGYDWVVIGGAKPFYERFFDITTQPDLQAWAMSSALVGCVIGAVASGYISDKFGRKWPLLISALLFTISSIGTGIALNYDVFILFRIIGGLGIGLASAISPMYIAEVAPTHVRGKFVSLNQFTIVIGILAAQLINLLIADAVPEGATDAFIRNSWNGQIGWRWMFYVCGVPAAIFFFLTIILPESPRWLVKAGKADKALPTLRKIGGEAYAQEELANIKATLNDTSEKVDFKALFHPSYRKVLIIGVFLAVFQQWCGINTVFNYAEEIFTAAGYGVSDTLFNIVITGFVNLVFTLIAMFTVDKWGRKNLMLFGSIGLAVSYILLGAAFYMQLKGVLVLLLVVLSIAIYSMSLAPIVWVILSEIFPNRIRGAAMALSTFFLWVACFILTYTFPLLNASMGAAGTFWIYSAICLIGFVFIALKLPETKGKSLEEIEKELVINNDFRNEDSK
jgi:sugar porter (SP) family MFS transporter